LAISVAFWKINPNVSTEDIAKVAVKLMKKGLYPPKGVKILGDYICPGGRGVTITESKSADAFKDWLYWVQEKKDIYECYEVHPAITSQDAIKIVLGK